MATERLTLYDTTLRDGQQTQGVQFSTDEKLLIATALDELGLDYVEAGWPGANPTDSEFFARRPPTVHCRITAFGMTKRSGRSASNDDLLADVLNAGTGSVCLVGKAHEFHVTNALRVPLEDNVDNIWQSINHLVKNGREALFDAEHFFDGYRSNRAYALECLAAAFDAGARWIVLCDTNGGTLPSVIGDITAEVIASGIPGSRLGIHTHDDTGTAVAGTLAAIDAGARQVQGTLNGLGERCGNANLVSIIPTLLLKEPYRSKFETGVTEGGLASLQKVSRMLDDILNRVPDKSAPYVGSSAFVHKAGLHASAVVRDPSTYEHVEPGLVGNQRVIPMSNQAGRSNLVARLKEAGIKVERDDSRLSEIIEVIKTRESQGYSYDTAQASFELLARRILGRMPEYFSVESFKVTVEQTAGEGGDVRTNSLGEAVIDVAGERRKSKSDGTGGRDIDNGPVHALARAVHKDLGSYQSYIEDMHLVDFKVRITSGGTEAVTRVIVDSEDREGRRWSTVGVSANIINASLDALVDAINWKLVRDRAPPP